MPTSAATAGDGAAGGGNARPRRLLLRLGVCCDRAAAFPSGEFMAFYDFASLHQKDPETGGRTGEEKTAFDSALGTMGTWYAHDKTTTVALDVFPAGWESTTPYGECIYPLSTPLLTPCSLHSPHLAARLTSKQRTAVGQPSNRP